jgi:hypothetical protein
MYFLSDNAKIISGIWAAVGLTIFFILYRNSKVKLAKE